MILKFQDFLFEIGDASIPPYKWKKSDSTFIGSYSYKFQSEDLEYETELIQLEKSNYMLVYSVKNNFKVETNRGQQYKIISTVIDILKSFIKEYHPKMIAFNGENKEGETKQEATIRTKFYRAYLTKNLPNNYTVIEKGNNTEIHIA